MPLITDNLRSRLTAWSREHGKASRWVVAFSGGRDSTVLLALLAEMADAFDARLLAAHVNHGLQYSADDWQSHCAQVAGSLGVEFLPIRVEVAQTGGDGPEGNARVARYRALEGLLGDGDWLLTAHHQDDQAETVLLNLMRGSGVSGVRGIAACRPLGPGLLLRPLLQESADDITAYARRNNLTWIEDVSNTDVAFDRNYLRATVLPLLAERWPAARRQLARSADLAAEAATLLDELAAIDIAACGTAERLDVDALAALTPARRRNAIRTACRNLSLSPPPARQLDAISDDLLPARDDAQPHVSWAGAEARRYRDRLYLLPSIADSALSTDATLTIDQSLELGGGLGRLRLAAGADGGIKPELAQAGLRLGFRQGGESFRPAGRGTTKSLKKLLQERGIVPWMRDRLPLLFADGSLVAVADMWVEESSFSGDGYSIVWDRKPAIL